MYPRPSPGTLEVDPSMRVGGGGGGVSGWVEWEGERLVLDPGSTARACVGVGGLAMGAAECPACHADLPALCPAATCFSHPLQWVHPAVNGVAIAADPRPLHADLHAYLAGGWAGLVDVQGSCPPARPPACLPARLPA